MYKKVEEGVKTGYKSTYSAIAKICN